MASTFEKLKGKVPVPLESLCSNSTGAAWLCLATVPWTRMRHTQPWGHSCNRCGRLRVPPVPSCPRVSVGAEILFCKEGCSVAVDTGASYITGPAGPVSVLMKAIGAAEMAEGEVSNPLLCPAPAHTAAKGLSAVSSPTVRSGLRPSPSAAQHLLPPGREGLCAQRLSLRPAGELRPPWGWEGGCPWAGCIHCGERCISACSSGCISGCSILHPPGSSSAAEMSPRMMLLVFSPNLLVRQRCLDEPDQPVAASLGGFGETWGEQ